MGPAERVGNPEAANQDRRAQAVDQVLDLKLLLVFPDGASSEQSEDISTDLPEGRGKRAVGAVGGLLLIGQGPELPDYLCRPLSHVQEPQRWGQNEDTGRVAVSDPLVA